MIRGFDSQRSQQVGFIEVSNWFQGLRFLSKEYICRKSSLSVFIISCTLWLFRDWQVCEQIQLYDEFLQLILQLDIRFPGLALQLRST
ncbi:MAG: hypothetical protein H0A75_02215 [Candidatus Methanofishera endochildressiae]|uniref:Uncharacterized protein n=1 Tax=Candidatus Methanofishera endochildressiae TaxID=2738884 RepID=A0A7Z0SCJ5_9GAMM|nr:hypothetical protein [Candidatus Methanofishera endochildressiae]